ncbi:MAG TPA: nucleotide-binding protein [Methanocorpusculum sp.]|nr:nucleotide-binding protein [Methanocorpusculum sp.]
MALNRHGNSERINVILDTNALMMPAQFSVDLEVGLLELLGGFRALVPAEVVYELRGLALGSSRKSAAAKFGLEFAKRFEVIPEHDAGVSVDDKIVLAAREFNAVVVTNDRGLKDKLTALQIPVIVLREKRRLELTGR